MSVSILLKPPEDRWQQIGELGSPRVIPGSVNLQSDDAGPLSASFMLRGRPGDPVPALLPFTPVKIDIDGLRVWSGFVRVPTGSGRTISVECAGNQAHLDGDLLQLVPADAQLTSWDAALCVAKQWTIQGTQQITGTAIVLGWPNDSATVYSASGEFNGVTYMAARHQISAVRVTASFSQSIGARFVVVGHDGFDVPVGPDALRIIDVPDTAGGVFTGDTGGLFFRFISIGYTGMPSTIPNNTFVTIPAVTAFDRAAYLAGLPGAEVARRYRKLIPQLSPDESRIAPTTFDLPHLERSVADTGRSGLTEAAAYDDALVKVDEFVRLRFEPRVIAARVELGGVPTGEAPQDPASMASAVDVVGQDPAGNQIRKRFAVPDDPSWPVRPADATISNPDFAVNVAGWTLSTNTALARGTTSPPPGIPAYALIQNTATPGAAWGFNEWIVAPITGTMLAGVAYRLDVYMFDASTTPPALLKAPTVALRIGDSNDLQAIVDVTLRLPQGTTAPYPWQKFSLSWVPRMDTTSAFVQIYNTPEVPAFSDGLVAGYAIYPCVSGVRIYTASTLLTRQRKQAVGQVQVPVIANDQVAGAVGVTYLRGSNRLAYTGTRVCGDGHARDARTHAPLPAVALLGLTGSVARVSDRNDPDTGAQGASAYLSAVAYDHATRQATCTLGSRYGATSELIARLTQ